MRVLLIEDYEPVRAAVSQGLSESAITVDAAVNGEEGLWYADGNDYDVIVLDLMLPDVPGLSILRRLRGSGCAARILILTAKDAVEDRVRGLNSGADDYVVKPFSFEELLARIHALVRRRYERPDPLIRVDNLVIDTSTKTARRGSRPIDLTKREYALMAFLAMREGQVVSRAEIWENLYRFESDIHSNVVDVYIRYLRRKLEQTGERKLIHTRRGFGYLFGVEGGSN